MYRSPVRSPSAARTESHEGSSSVQLRLLALEQEEAESRKLLEEIDDDEREILSSACMVEYKQILVWVQVERAVNGSAVALRRRVFDNWRTYARSNVMQRFKTNARDMAIYQRFQLTKMAQKYYETVQREEEKKEQKLRAKQEIEAKERLARVQRQKEQYRTHGNMNARHIQGLNETQPLVLSKSQSNPRFSGKHQSQPRSNVHPSANTPTLFSPTLSRVASASAVRAPSPVQQPYALRPASAEISRRQQRNSVMLNDGEFSYVAPLTPVSTGAPAAQSRIPARWLSSRQQALYSDGARNARLSLIQKNFDSLNMNQKRGFCVT